MGHFVGAVFLNLDVLSFIRSPSKSNRHHGHECSDLADFKAQLSAAGSKLVVVDFHATWCGPCKMIAPIIVEMAGKMDNVVFLKVDVDEAEDVAGEYNISAMPTFVFLKDGKKIDDLMGANADKLKELVNKHSS